MANVNVVLSEEERDHLVEIHEMIMRRRSPRAIQRTAVRMNYQEMMDKLRNAKAEAPREAPAPARKAARKKATRASAS